MGRVSALVALIARADTKYGYAAGLALAKEGACLVLAGSNPSAIMDASSQIAAETGADTDCSFHDTANEESWKQLVDKCLKRFGKVDILVNGPPDEIRIRITETGLSDLQKLEEINIVGPWLGCKSVLGAMKRNGQGGAIVNISSSAVRLALPDTAINSACAAGIRIMTQAIALECGEQDTRIRINSVLIGSDTTKATEVGEAVVYLASSESSFMTAGEIMVGTIPRLCP